MYKLFYKFRRREVWSICVYCYKGNFDFNFLNKYKLIFKFTDSNKKYSRKYRSICADPFLISNESDVFLFFETQNDFSKGQINCISFDRVTKLFKFDFGVVLSENFHLSFPNVFRLHGEFYMLPECAESNQVILYRADVFPRKWKKFKVILEQPLLDVALHFSEFGCHLLGTDRLGILKHFIAKDIFSEFSIVPNLITDDLKHKRNGGNFIIADKQLFRIAQVNEKHYGEAIAIKKIEKIDNLVFQECNSYINIVSTPLEYMSEGHHHISVLQLEDYNWVAIDGFKKNTFLNLLNFLFLKLILISLRFISNKSMFILKYFKIKT